MSNQPTVLPWHREAAKEIELHLICNGDISQADVFAIIARHDENRTDSPALRLLKNQHAATLRLLGLALENLDGIQDGTDIPSMVIRDEIRAHLAAQKGSQ